jgi:SpoVK/Ycf46/Vps4 family AAA+-type ATPase
MQHIPEIMKIIEAGLQEDSTKVYNYSNLLIENLIKEEDTRSADKLKKAIKNSKTFSLKLRDEVTAKNIPVDSESRLSLADLEYYSENEVFLSVPEDILNNLEEYIDLINKSGTLLGEDIRIYRNMLIYGPAGVGKTQAARYISAKTGLPLITVRIDGLISSYLGSTSKNIRTLFDFVSKTPCILFLDEFDAIAKMRDDSQEVGELKRVVNTLLQNIDSISNKVPIVAATNHQHLLDSAVWRRFDYRLAFELPNNAQRSGIIKHFLQWAEVESQIFEILTSMTNGFSGAEIQTFMEMIKTNYLLGKIKGIDEKTLFNLFMKYQTRNSSGKTELPETNVEKKTKFLKMFRQDNPKLFTYRILSNMTGFSTGKISGIIGGTKDGERKVSSC